MEKTQIDYLHRLKVFTSMVELTNTKCYSLIAINEDEKNPSRYKYKKRRGIFFKANKTININVIENKIFYNAKYAKLINRVGNEIISIIPLYDIFPLGLNLKEDWKVSNNLTIPAKSKIRQIRQDMFVGEYDSLYELMSFYDEEPFWPGPHL